MAPREIECPICFFVFALSEDPLLNDIVPCPDCGADLEIVEITPDKIATQKVRIDEDWGE